MSNQIIKFAMYAVLLIVGLAATHQLTKEQLLEDNRVRTQRHAEQLAQYIDSEFSRYSRIVEFLSDSAMVRQTISLGNATDDVDRYLNDVQQASGASDVYLLDRNGTVIATSNWLLEHSYKGNNFAFRPYFKRAIQGQSVIDFALGQRSKQRGFYFSQGVAIDGEIQGVIVLKANASKFETDKARLDTSDSSQFVLFDTNKVVLLSNNPQWQLHSVSTLPEQQLRQLQSSQQFLFRDIAAIDWQVHDSQTMVRANKQLYVMSQAPITDTDYRLWMLSPISPFADTHAARLAVAFVVLLLLILLVEYLSVKLAGYRQLLFSQSSLEAQVQERTIELEQAQDALIRAAKLATIGQLSASVNHEINQPLSAMSAYAAATKRLIARGETEKALENIALIEQLIRRVHAIAAQLKSFSQKHDNKMCEASLVQCIDNALIVVGPELNRHQVSIEKTLIDVNVWVDPYQFEQVLVNLFSNACQAMEQQSNKQLRVEAMTQDAKVYLSIIDSGLGIEHHALNSIFEPFYTTKSEHGLGLGLSISKQIIESFHGNLSAHNHPDGGAEFLISLHQQEPES
ncbi:sensor histidine kinase [Pseudoalteromonas pernae]|uniref:sensor histidine kinase n=1 Tax=Pseudoalteromonas pernae TaxID=3118054 RepID=UPI003242EEF6